MNPATHNPQCTDHHCNPACAQAADAHANIARAPWLQKTTPSMTCVVSHGPLARTRCWRLVSLASNAACLLSSWGLVAAADSLRKRVRCASPHSSWPDTAHLHGACKARGTSKHGLCEVNGPCKQKLQATEGCIPLASVHNRHDVWELLRQQAVAILAKINLWMQPVEPVCCNNNNSNSPSLDTQQTRLHACIPQHPAAHTCRCRTPPRFHSAVAASTAACQAGCCSAPASAAAVHSSPPAAAK
jgi:hypothetical protein